MGSRGNTPRGDGKNTRKRGRMVAEGEGRIQKNVGSASSVLGNVGARCSVEKVSRFRSVRKKTQGKRCGGGVCSQTRGEHWHG